jgi:hypothetical protein
MGGNDRSLIARRGRAGVAVATLLALATPAAPALARDSLGIFERWGAFRDGNPLRCYAIAEPVATGRRGAWRPFASIGHWPGRGVRNQLHIRLSRAVAPNAPITLSIGERRFELTGGGADAWAADARADAAIVAAMRGAARMTIRARATTGGRFTDSYALRGAATAIDAAALGCGRR